MSVRMTGVPPTRCPECEGRLRPVGTELVCEECGLVTEGDVIDHGPEWRSFDRAERKRTGARLTRSRHDRGLSTRIGSGSRIRVTGRKRRQLARMCREQARARFETKADYNRMTGFTEIRRIVSQLSLPGAVREQACTLFESAQTEDLLVGRSLEGFAAAVVYATCRTRDIARTREEILEISRADGDELAAAYAALNRELGLPTGPIDPGVSSPVRLPARPRQRRRTPGRMVRTRPGRSRCPRRAEPERRRRGLSLRRRPPGRLRVDHPGDGCRRRRRLARDGPIDGRGDQSPRIRRCRR